jgi:acyl-CoA thioester hydrolase
VRAMPGRGVSGPPLLTWRGCANAWDCDEMGHMNVRHYVGKWSEGLGALAAALAMPLAFKRQAGSTIAPLDQHIRFLAEARAGAPLSMQAGIVDFGETDAQVYQEMRHADGRVAATYLTRVAHADVKSGASFAWSARARAAGQGLKTKVPAIATARSIDLTAPPSLASVGEADRLGAHALGLSLVQPQDCDVFGRLRPEGLIGRISDAAPHLFQRWREEAGHSAGGKRYGGAVVEYRILYRRWPQAGDLIAVRSGIAEMTPKFFRVIHWLLDPVRGDAFATAEAIAITFDLDARKAVACPAERLKALEPMVTPGMAV